MCIRDREKDSSLIMMNYSEGGLLKMYLKERRMAVSYTHLKRYGEEFCKLIKRHCEENEIERPEDLRVRTVARCV